MSLLTGSVLILSILINSGGQERRLRSSVSIQLPRLGMKKDLILANEVLVWMEAAGKECACAFW